jgi:hypothetical protein
MLLVVAIALAAAALAVALFGRPFQDGSGERTRAVTYAGTVIDSVAGGSDHVSGASRIAHNLWHVELKENVPRGYPRPPTYTCLTIQLDRFYIHADGNRGGVTARDGRCP